MNIFFEFMSMILKDHMFKIDLSRFPKVASRIFFYFLRCPKKQSRLQVDEILIFFAFLVNGHLKFTYALSASKVKIIYQSFNVKIFLNTIPLVNFKNTFDLLLVY